ncbi:hypothetical protein [Pararhodobacter sp.]|uniref:hypothetical protein n=1 Tax=Pararhodobacter sp. TaxID=2127056 RepID=UPI002FDE727B
MPDTPHELFALIQSAWAQIFAVIALIVWLIRGEATTKANAAEIRRVWRQRAEDMATQEKRRSDDLEAAKEARDTTNEMLKEVRNDIKKLLSRRD